MESPRWIRVTICPPWTEKDEREREEKEREKTARLRKKLPFHPERHNCRVRFANTDVWGMVKRRNVSVDQHIGVGPGPMFKE